MDSEVIQEDFEAFVKLLEEELVKGGEVGFNNK
jgi:hypothetical protein